jgi:hypothetical protein
MSDTKKPFEQMDMAAACKECDKEPDPVFDDCPACRQRVGLHCATCKIQVTGCTCTDRARFDPEVVWEHTCVRVGERKAKEIYRANGWAIPGEDLILPSSN